MIKLRTNKTHRFNNSIVIQGESFRVNGTGQIEVPEKIVTFALEVGFELVDKDTKFSSKEEQDKVTEVESILASAKASAEEIIKEAERKAEEIVMKANMTAGRILEESNVDEKEEFLKKLKGRPVEELREILVSSDLKSSEEVKDMKKNEVIATIMEAKFS